VAIFDLYSKKQKALRGDAPDVYQYKSIPHPLRVQIVQIVRRTVGNHTQYLNRLYKVQGAYAAILSVLHQEYGVFNLSGSSTPNQYPHVELESFLLTSEDTEKVIDVILLAFRVVNNHTREYSYLHRHNASEIADEAISDLNGRFKEHAFGFEFIDGEIFRIDSQLVHAEVVKPLLSLLRGDNYQGAEAEYLSAHKHYRDGEFKETLADCLKAFESVMKVICAKRSWTHDPNATSKALIECCMTNGLIPTVLQSEFTGLRTILESGVPTVRNKFGGHGQGEKIVEVPPHIASFALHMTATTLVLLVEADAALR